MRTEDLLQIVLGYMFHKQVYNNINGVYSDVAIHIDESGDACLNASTCTSSGGHDNINLSQQSDTLAKSHLVYVSQASLHTS
jgi:hypothetical protein